MKYEIQQEYDLEKGLMFRVSFPEEDVDKKALYTVQNDMPDFLIPFKCRTMDGMMQCTYYVGSDTKLQNRMGECGKSEYINCWKRVLSPLLTCKDWFLSAYSFVFDISYLYTDKNETYVRYLYVPSKKAASDFSQLSSMVADIARENTVADTIMENAVLRTIMQGFSPKEFLSLIESFDSQSEGSSLKNDAVGMTEKRILQPQSDGIKIFEKASEKVSEKSPKVSEKIIPKSVFHKQQPASEPQKNVQQSVPEPQRTPIQPNPFDEIQILFSDEDDAGKKGGFSFGKKAAREEQPEKPTKAKAEKEKGGFFSRLGIGKKKSSTDNRMAENENVRDTGFHREEIDEQIYEMRRRTDEEDMDSETIIGLEQNNQPSLTYIGNLSKMPARIEVSIGPDLNGSPNERESVKRFTIGRFDVNVGKRQSDFEFAENTRGVSRHHAIIERRGRTYSITDLNSSAGTVVNGIILRANQTAELTNNCHVSFGYDGADYVWRE